MLRISRYLTRARELETDPAKMKQDLVARLIGHLAGQRHELEEILKRQRRARTARLSFSCQDRSWATCIRSSSAIDSCCPTAAK